MTQYLRVFAAVHPLPYVMLPSSGNWVTAVVMVMHDAPSVLERGNARQQIQPGVADMFVYVHTYMH